MRTKPPVVSAGYVADRQHADRPIHLDTPDWFAWLETATTTSFSYPLFDPRCGYIVGFMTVRKESRRGCRYWWVFRRDQGRVRKIYLGHAATVTGMRLATIAGQLLQARSQPGERGPHAPREPPAVPDTGNDGRVPGLAATWDNVRDGTTQPENDE